MLLVAPCAATGRVGLPPAASPGGVSWLDVAVPAARTAYAAGRDGCGVTVTTAVIAVPCWVVGTGVEELMICCFLCH